MPRQGRKPVAASHHGMPLPFLKGAPLLLQIAAELARFHRSKYKTYVSCIKDIFVLFQDYLWSVLVRAGDGIAPRRLCRTYSKASMNQLSIRCPVTGGSCDESRSAKQISRLAKQGA